MSARDSGVEPSGQDRTVSVLRTVLQLAVVSLAYWFAARLSLGLALVHGQVTPIWPPTGMGVVAILVFGGKGSVFALTLPLSRTISATHLQEAGAS